MKRNDAASDPDAVEVSNNRASSTPEAPANETHQSDTSHSSSTKPDMSGHPDIGRFAGGEDISLLKDGDDYLIVGTDEQAPDKELWMIREPQTREAVVEGEQLWKIPDNWQQYLTVRAPDGADEILYHIDETNIDVIIRVPQQDNDTDPRYCVQNSGKVIIYHDRALPQPPTEDRISELRNQKNTPTALVAALRAIEDHWPRFEQDYRDAIREKGEDAIWQMFESEDRAVVDSWTVELEAIEHDFTQHFPDDLPSDHHSDVASLLIDADIITTSPEFKIMLDERNVHPPGYYVQALTEAGCTPAETVDYLMVELLHHTPRSWSELRGEHKSEIQQRVNAVDNRLTS